MRKLRTLTQEGLGERSGVSGKLVGQIERGMGNPTLEVIAGLAGALDVEPAVLLQFEEEHPVGGTERAARGQAAAEEVERYLLGRPVGEVERALRILHAVLDEPKSVK